MKLFHVTSIASTLNFLDGQIAFLKSKGFSVHAITSPSSALTEFGRKQDIPVHGIAIQRVISPVRDLSSLFQLYRLFKQQNPDLVHSHTPKAALLAMAAAKLAKVERRFFHIHGLPHSTATGITRLALKLSTTAAAYCATDLFAVSPSVADQCKVEHLSAGKHVKVLAKGSINGVDSQHAFSPCKQISQREAQALLHIPPNSTVLGFAGRLVRDKGISELLSAWNEIRDEFPDTLLLIAGEPEQRNALDVAILEQLKRDERIVLIGWRSDMATFYSAIDILVLPSYREGLPTVVLEAAAMQVPTIAFEAVGCVDAIVHGVTGLLVPVGDSYALADAMRQYILDPLERSVHGRSARERVVKEFWPEHLWLATLNEYKRKPRQRHKLMSKVVKRLLDITIACLALIVLSPLLLAAALAIRLSLGSPVLFRQQRPGIHERIFQMVKFRTMREAVGANGKPLPDADRLTSLGSFLRRISLDELPELWNVLKGDMSLVGPRPLLPRYLERYTEEQRRRHDVKPGITGWAQVNGRNALSWEERFTLDTWYVDNQSLRLDLQILWRTVQVVLKREGIAQEGHATMPEFGVVTDS